VRRSTTAVAVLLLSVLGACGGSDSPASDGDENAGSATSAAPAEDDADDADDADDSDGSSSAAVDPCTLLTPEQVGPILGGAVTLKEAPGGGCGFDQEDPRAASVGFFAVDGAGGGFDASKQGNVVDGDTEDVPDAGDGAWLAVGTSGGDNLQGQGVVAIGDTLVNISLTQGNGLGEADVRQMMESLIALVASVA